MSIFARPLGRGLLGTVATAAVIAASLVFTSTPAGAATPPSSPTPDATLARQLAKVAKPTSFKTGNYVVTLKGSSAASYTGGVKGFSATHPAKGDHFSSTSSAVKSYSSYLGSKQKTVAGAVGAKIRYSYTLALNGFAAHLSGAQALTLSKRSDVLAVTPDTILHPQAEPDYNFLGLQDGSTPDTGIWDAVGGVANAGKGIVVGDLDTGISAQNPSFAGPALGTTPSSTTPYLSAGGQIVFHKADGSTFSGECETDGADEDLSTWNASDCNTKIIGARYYDAGFPTDFMGIDQGLEVVSPLDVAGHGSHTASTAAGNYDVTAHLDDDSDPATPDADFGDISGMAPAAKIAMYKVCWSGPDPTVETDDGCATSDMVAAINQAVADGVDVLNFSIGGDAAQTTYSPTDQAFENAAAAGIFVATAAGNAGPDSTTLDNASPWYTTVAASTIPSYEGTAEFGDGSKYPGATITVPAAGVSGDLVRGDLVAAATYPSDSSYGDLAGTAVDPDDALLCEAGTLDPALVTGKIVFCARGVNDRVAKSAEVKRAGGIGMILVNPTSNTTDLDQHSVPTVAIDAASFDPAGTTGASPTYHSLYLYAGSDGATVDLVRDNTSSYSSAPTPQIAGFSSRGPVEAAGSDVLKPEISAPGVSILADGPSVIGDGGSITPSYEFMSGTSMATPHITGLAALYLGVHPTATPAEIKSAMMTTAYNTVDAQGDDVTDPFQQGAGEVDPTKYLTPGLLYLNGLTDWNRYLNAVAETSDSFDRQAASELNLPSISIGQFADTQTVTRTVTSTQAGTYTATASVPGFDVDVEPSTPLTFTAAGQQASYTVTFTRTSDTLAPTGEFSTGSIVWTGSGDADGITVSSPVVIRPVAAIVPSDIDGSGAAGTVGIPVINGADGVPDVSSIGLAPTVTQPDDGTADDPSHSGGGSSADPETNVHDYFLEIPAGTVLAKFDEDAIDNSNDYDLVVYKLTLDGDGNIVGADVVGTSATSSADESVTLNSPDAGVYAAEVQLYDGSGDFNLYTTILSSDGGEGGFTATLPDTPAEAGASTTATAAWSGLEPGTQYTGLVTFGDGGPSTFVHVATPVLEVANTTAPGITGTPQTDSTLTASPGTWKTAGGDDVTSDLTFHYAWTAGGIPVGTDSDSYTVAAGDVGEVISVQVTADDTSAYTIDGPAPAVSVTAEAAPLANTAVPTISGTPAVGETLTAAPGAWSADGVTLAYQWNVDGTPISGATGTSLTVAPSAAGAAITVTVTATKPGYTTASASSLAAGVPLQTITSLGAPKITGTARVGSTLAASTGIWSVPSVQFSYQWYASGKAIAGASSAKLKLAASVGGKKITVTVTAAKTGYAPATATSKAVTVAATAKVKVVLAKHIVAGKAHITATVTVTSKAKVSGTVTVKVTGKSYKATLKAGKAKVDIAKTHKGVNNVTVSYSGSATVAPASAKAKIRL